MVVPEDGLTSEIKLQRTKHTVQGLRLNDVAEMKSYCDVYLLYRAAVETQSSRLKLNRLFRCHLSDLFTAHVLRLNRCQPLNGVRVMLHEIDEQCRLCV